MTAASLPATPALLRAGWTGPGPVGLPMAQRVLAAGFLLQLWARRLLQAAGQAAHATCQRHGDQAGLQMLAKA